MKQINRYHKDIFFPAWSEQAIEFFIQEIKANSPITLSLHSVDKLISSHTEYGKIIWKVFSKIIRKGLLNKDCVFEFYSNEDFEIKKACFRFPVENLPINITIVISNNANVITMYIVNQNDKHNSLKKELYNKE